MGRGVIPRLGGILGLVDLLREHREAIEYDLITHGLRLRDLPSPGFDWRDLWVIIRHAGPDSALTVSLDGREAVEWDLTNQLLAAAVDALSFLRWAKTEDAQRPGAQPPALIPRPGVEPEGPTTETDSMDEDEAFDFLGDRFAHLREEREDPPEGTTE